MNIISLEKNAFAKDHKQAFNLEKESKIINPHPMELKTTMREVHNGSKGERAEARIPVHKLD